MGRQVWYFAPGTETRVLCTDMGNGHVMVPCGVCKENMMLTPGFGITIEQDGALSTKSQLNCPSCKSFTVRFDGGVVRPG